ncbi:MAG: TIM barrel protein [Candidatus Aenigmarchaeota archaeon]|nr:TIM barrel protein [Candidatus Aenigmarchaeota archaeon]
MKLGFVAGLVDTKTGWIINTAKKFSECTDEIVVEFHQEHKWLKNLKLQSRNKKLAEKKLEEFCDASFGIHTPWEPEKNYRVINKKFGDRDIISWLRFAVDNGIEFVNMHIEWGDGVRARKWINDPALRNGYIRNAAENLKNIFSFAESNNIKLSLETLPSCLYVEKYGEYLVSFPAFPEDYLRLREISGFNFGINPDVCHAAVTWWNMQNNVKYGIYESDRKWKKMSLENFVGKFIRKSKPVHQIHLADFRGNKSPSEHAIALGDGMLTGGAIKSVLENIEKKTALILEIQEDWTTKRGMAKADCLPESVRSLEKLSSQRKLFK